MSYGTPNMDRMNTNSGLKGSIRVPITLSWRDVHYQVAVPTRKCQSNAQKERKVILNGISGITKPGQLLAIMGSTGKSFSGSFPSPSHSPSYRSWKELPS